MKLLLSIAANGQFQRITHYFPIRGHSYLPCDRDFGLIKRFVRRADRVYVPDDYISMILGARKVTPFEVKRVETKDILDFKNWWPKYYKKDTLSIPEAATKEAKK